MKSFLTGVAFGALMLGGSNLAYAAAPGDGGDEASGRGFDDIIVTATRREEKLQDVPVAVSAFTAESLARQGITKAEDLARITPSLAVSRYIGEPAATSFGIRGQRSQDIRPMNDPSVVTYIAEVPQKMPFGIGVSGFLDLKSVEVLRGPQGTLFGRNSTGGAVLLVPNTPTDRLEGSVRFTAGNFKQATGEAIANVPLGEGVGFRVAGIVHHRDPWMENRSGKQDFNGEDYVGLRGSFQVESGSLRSTFYADYVHFKGTGQGNKLTGVNPNGLANNLYGGAVSASFATQQVSDFWSAYGDKDAKSESKVWGVSNTTTLELSDTLVLKNVIGYRYVEAFLAADVDATPAHIIESENYDDDKQFSEELQLQYNTDGFKLIAGAFYFKERGHDGRRRAQVNAFEGFSVIGRPDETLVNSAKSVFAEGTYDLSSQFHLTLGGRYTWDKRYRSSAQTKDLSRNFFNPPGAPTILCNIGTDTTPSVPFPLSSCFTEASVSFSKFTWNATVQYEFSPRSQAYASFRRGYRTGGYSLSPQTPLIAQLFYKPETVDSYEAGYKGQFDLGANSQMRMNLAAYYSKYKDAQKAQNRSFNDILITETVNAASATIYGLESELAFNFGDHVQLNAAYTYTHGDYDRFVTTEGDFTDAAIGFLPKHKLSGTGRFELEAGDGIVAFQPTVVWVSSQYLYDLPDPGTLQKAYTTVNARVEWSPNDSLTFGLWSNNLTKTKYNLAAVGIYSSLGYSTIYTGEPRTWGVDLSAKF